MPKNKPSSASTVAPTLRLRNDAQRVSVIVPNGTTRPVLGTREPGADDERRRAATIAAAGGGGSSPRQARLASIELELPRRTGTILSHRLPRALQDRINGGGVAVEALAASRKGGATDPAEPTVLEVPVLPASGREPR